MEFRLQVYKTVGLGTVTEWVNTVSPGDRAMTETEWISKPNFQMMIAKLGWAVI